MFKMRYGKLPNKYTVTTIKHSQVANKINNDNIYLMHHGIDLNKVTNTYKKDIKYMSNIYHFDYNHFMSDNFKKQKNYLVVKNPRKSFSSNVKSNPWMCINVNFFKIVNAILVEADRNNHLTNVDIANRDYLIIRNQSNTKNVIKQVEQKSGVQNMSNNQSNNELHRMFIDYMINHTNSRPFSYCNNYRKPMRRFWNPYHSKYYFFSANIQKLVKKSSHHSEPSIVLSNIMCHNCKVATHCHLFGDDMMNIRSKGFSRGTNICFYAQVKRYIKGNHDVPNEYHLDFVLKNVKDVHHNGYHYPDVPTDKRALLHLINQYLPASQLRFILENYINHVQSGLKSIQSEITPVQNRLHHLKALQSNLKNEQTIFNQNKKTKVTAHLNHKVTKSDQNNHVSKHYQTPKLITHKSVHKNTVPNLLKAVAMLWLHQFNSVIAKQYNVSINKVLGLSKCLKNYAQRSKITFNLDKNARYNTFAGVYQIVNNVYEYYSQSRFNALKDYYNKANHDTIIQVEDNHNLSHGTLYKLRKSKLGQVVKTNA